MAASHQPQLKIACVSVDLDAIPHYLGIHGMWDLEVSEDVCCAVCRVALGRFLELFDALGIRTTLFAVGADLADEESASAVRNAFEAGHEIASHTNTHPYALTKLSSERLLAEIEGAEDAIRRVTGTLPRGFRAPGYAVSAELMQLLENRGYAYDSSAFPAAPYYLAKAGIMGALALAGRPSAAILDRPRVLFSPRVPYRPDVGEPYRRARGAEGALKLWELPMSVSPHLAIPLIGTSALLFPRPLVGALVKQLSQGSWFNLELHGIDLLDASDLNLPELARVQRELNIPVQHKMARLKEVIGCISDSFQVMTLKNAVDALKRGDTAA